MSTDNDTKSFIVLILSILLFLIALIASGTYKEKLRLEQPRYYIEFDGRVYEFVEVGK